MVALAGSVKVSCAGAPTLVPVSASVTPGMASTTVFEAALIGRARLLVIDELGFLPLDADGARLLFQIFADAYERQSVVITTNLEFSRWGSVFGDDQMAAAVIDRIVHHGRLVQFRGESYRVRHALMQEG